MYERVAPVYERLAPVVYRVTETDLDGAQFCHVRGWDAATANHMVNRMIRKAEDDIQRGREPGHTVDPATDATGRLVLRHRNLSFGRREGQVLGRWRTWVLEPVARPKLSEQYAEDLEALAASRYWPGDDLNKPQSAGGVLRSHRSRAREEMRLSCSGMYSIPPAAWRRLVAKGWASLLTGEVKDMQPAGVTVAGKVALALREHQTRTTVPLGYIHSADHPDPAIARSGTIGPWRKGGRIFDGASAVACSAGCFRGRWMDRRYMAQTEARGHRAEQVLLALGASPEQAQLAAKRARSTPGGVIPGTGAETGQAVAAL